MPESNQCRRRSPRRQPQHAAQLGAPLRLSRCRSAPPGNHRNYELVELQTLRDALAQTGNISSAIELARQRQAAPASGGSLLAAFESFDEEAADRAIEESLALRPLERTVEELLLPAIDELAADPDREAELEFAARWATGWLHGARRLASAASRPAGILLLDSSRGSDAEAVHAQALDLALRRAGFRVLMLSDELGEERLERALRRARPDRDRPLRPRRRHRRRGASWSARSARPGFDAPLFGFRASRPDRRRVPLRRRAPERGHRDAQRRPPPPRLAGLRLATAALRLPPRPPNAAPPRLLLLDFRHFFSARLSENVGFRARAGGAGIAPAGGADASGSKISRSNGPSCSGKAPATAIRYRVPALAERSA